MYVNLSSWELCKNHLHDNNDTILEDNKIDAYWVQLVLRAIPDYITEISCGEQLSIIRLIKIYAIPDTVTKRIQPLETTTEFEM